MENRGYKGWGVKKLDNRPLRVLMKDCEDPKLYAKCYNMYIGGYTEEEVGKHMAVDVEVVERAIQHTRSCLSSRTIVSHNNDRMKILIQRSESEQYRRLLGEALRTNVKEFLAAGVSPVGVLKEFREATGAVEKPGSFTVQVNQQSIVANSPQITSSEDLLRSVLMRMKLKEQTQTHTETLAPGPAPLSIEGEEDVEAELPESYCND
jgi:hypothetical protein